MKKEQWTHIPLKPLSVNEAFQGKRFKTKKCKDFESNFFLFAPKMKKISGAVSIEYRFHLKNHKMTDVDNLVKILQDAIVKCGYIDDDRMIYKSTSEKIPSKDDMIFFRIQKYLYV